MSSATSPSTAGDSDAPPPLLIPSLPNDVALQCLARTPRSHHPTLSLVSKSWRSILKSPLLFTTRSLLSCTQHFLYLNIRINSSFRWFTLSQKPPNPIILSQVPPIPSQAIGSAFAVLGPKIYVMGGSVNDIPSRNVWVFNCCINQWEIGPKMRVGREFAAAGVVDGRIYVMGGCLVDTWAKSTNWAEVFDPVVGRWATVVSPVEVREKWMHASAVVGGKVFAMADRGGVVFNPKWRLGRIRGFDVEKDTWKEVKGIDEGLPKFLCGATMANVGGRLVVVWEGKGNGKEMEVSCAEIDVRKDGDGGLSGSIIWSYVILSVPIVSSIVHCLAVGL
ncbi:hypothetical protein L1049_002267 [Liquidambar formosana]|uniref:F-box domain-containing protein n=1 Tax=Liquidambar formosana TaxID=63359 RepID=A0AAP0R6J4_LIQFO